MMDLLTIATEGIFAAPSTPPAAPTASNPVRNGLVGSVDISAVAATDFVTCHAANPSTRARVLIGSITGPGTMALDFSSFIFTFLTVPYYIAAFNLEFQSSNAGLYSAVTDLPFVHFLSSSGYTISNYIRHDTMVEFDVDLSVTPTMHQAFIFWSKWDGSYDTQGLINGHNTIMGLLPLCFWRYAFVMVWDTNNGEDWFRSSEFGDTYSIAPSLPTVDNLNVLIYQLIKTDPVFQGLTGADASDPRIYLEYPPEKIACDVVKPGWATYGLTGGAGITDDRVFLSTMPDRVYAIDVWARTKDDCDRIYKQIEHLLIYRYFDETTEERVKLIRPLGPGIAQFVADVRLYHAHGEFNIKGVWRKNCTP
jgi:hypothetical protein